MVPQSKANIDTGVSKCELRLDQGTTTVSEPKAGRRVMTTMARFSDCSLDLKSGLSLAGEILRAEADALLQIASQIDFNVVHAAHFIAGHSGITHVTGVGKAGLVGQKFTSTAASFGFRCFFLHPVEAVHGDLGRVSSGDLIIALSQSGESEEVLRLCGAARRAGAKIISLTSTPTNPLGLLSDLTIGLGSIEEACTMGLAPTTSTTVMMAVCDVIAILAGKFKGVLPENFAANHPAGKLGRKLCGVEQIMRTGNHIRLAVESENVRDVLLRLGGARRRSGAILVLREPDGPLSGIFTDSDLVRLLERGKDHMLDRPVRESMTSSPSIIHISATVADAVESLRARKLSELPVVDSSGRPVGLIDVTDLIGLVPTDADEEML